MYELWRMQRVPLITKDGSHTIAIPEMGVTYHSVHGAIQESQHVFIDAGFNYMTNKINPAELSILEMGFGTGLNALLTYIEAEQKNISVHYTTLELFPLNENEIQHLNYCTQLNRPDLIPFFNKLHTTAWEEDVVISPTFILKKLKCNLLKLNLNLNLNLNTHSHFHIIYYDAFAPSAQPELWTQGIFEKLYSLLHTNGILVTYCSKGNVRRAMQAVGFLVEKLPGPPRKREMLRAIKK